MPPGTKWRHVALVMKSPVLRIFLVKMGELSRRALQCALQIFRTLRGLRYFISACLSLLPITLCLSPQALASNATDLRPDNYRSNSCTASRCTTAVNPLSNLLLAFAHPDLDYPDPFSSTLHAERDNPPHDRLLSAEIDLSSKDALTSSTESARTPDQTTQLHLSAPANMASPAGILPRGFPQKNTTVLLR